MHLWTFIWALQVTITILLTVFKSTNSGVCGGTRTENNSVIFSPNYYWSGYPPNLDCWWQIIAPDGRKIRLTFSSFSLERESNCNYDYVLLQEANGEMIGRFCGNVLPPVITSKKKGLWVKFHSDARRTGSGFRANYEFIRNERSCAVYRTENNNNEIFSPMYPQSYPSDVECTWQIKAPEGHTIRLTFSNFSLEVSDNCQYDQVLIEETEGDTIGKFCGSDKPPVIASLNNTINVKFYADGLTTGVGFKARYEFLPKLNESCGGNLTVNGSELSSPMYPQTYPPNIKCTWLIKAPAKYIIRMTFFNFSLDVSDNCTYDYVLVEEAEGDTIGKNCGTWLPGEITSKNNALRVSFHSDRRVVGGEGFIAKYKFLPNTRNCGVSHRTQNNSQISSPRYPLQYPNDVDCTWQIEAPVGHIIRLMFTNFNLKVSDSCEDDYVLVEGREGDGIRKFCGTGLPPVIISKNNTLKVNFHSGRSVGGDGFRAKYLFLPNPSICGGNRTENNSEISSPLYPESYPHNIECTWRIKAPEGHRIRLTFSSFNLEEDSENCQFDYVLVEETEGDAIGKFCGAEIPPVITSLSNTMIVTFHADHGDAGDGFEARYEFLPESNENSTFSGEANKTVEHGITNSNALHGITETTEVVPLETQTLRASEMPPVTEMRHDTDGTDASHETGVQYETETSHVTDSALQGQYGTETSRDNDALNQTDGVETPLATEMTYSSETVPDKTAMQTETLVSHETETSRDRDAPHTPLLETSSHVSQYPCVMPEAVSVTEKCTCEAKKTVEVVFGILFGLSTLVNVVGLYIYAKRSRKTETDIPLTHSVCPHLTEDSSSYDYSSRKGSVTLIF